MTDLTNKQKKEWAKTLYLKERLTINEIAEKVNISRQSLSRWIKEERWEDLKTSLTLTRQEQVGNLYRQVSEINNAIAARKEGERYATSKEADSLVKLANAIDKMETDIGIKGICEAGGKFIDWLRAIDLDKAKNITQLYDAFIKDCLKGK
jgi:predicted DNA-binding protein YlxM (UPF0122 family)